MTERKRWPFDLKDELMLKQGGLCWLCGERCDWSTFDGSYASYPTFEHKVPLKAGGADELRNLAITHRGCNGLRDSRPLPEWDETRRGSVAEGHRAAVPKAIAQPFSQPSQQFPKDPS